MESNDPLCVRFVSKYKYQDNAWILGELSFIIWNPILSINLSSFQLTFDFYLMCLWKTNLFLLMLCAIMKNVEGVWFIWCNLVLSRELLSHSLLCVLSPWMRKSFEHVFFFLICSLALPRYLQLVLIGI